MILIFNNWRIFRITIYTIAVVVVLMDFFLIIIFVYHLVIS